MFSRRHKAVTRRASWRTGVRTSLLWPGLCALLVAGGGVGGFLAWASTAPIAGAVIASGHIAASGENQTIQHLEGGIVKTLHVRDGDVVTAGQPLISLDPTLAEATLNRARKTLLTLRADEVRLLAEQRDLDAIAIPPELLAHDLDPSVRDFIETKVIEFEHRVQKSRSEVRILQQRFAGLEEEAAGLQAQRTATEKQAVFIREELRDMDYLFQKGLSRADRLFALRRTEADLEGRAGALLASIGKAKQSMAEVREQIEKIGHERRTEAGTRLSDVRTRIADTLEQIVASESILSRIVVRAPVDGTVVRLVANTVGGVIPAGQTIIEILPRGVELVVDARLQPTDIDAVQVGGAANVRLAALNHRTTPVVPARVAYVSADRLTDRGNQQVYYRVRLELLAEHFNARDRALLAAGMPAEAFIQTAERTMLQYLLRPIEDSLARTLRAD
jgi:HlyD family type I secretion membrane fusion protein